MALLVNSLTRLFQMRFPIASLLSLLVAVLVLALNNSVGKAAPAPAVTTGSLPAHISPFATIMSNTVNKKKPF